MYPHREILLRRLAILSTAALVLSTRAHSAPLDIQLTFSSLPSAQGFTYAAAGSHAGTPEGNVFSVAGGVLTQNTIGLSNGVSGGSIFYQILGGITTSETKEIRVRARCLQVEGSANAPAGEGGFIFGFNTGTVQYAFGLTPSRISYLQPGGTALVPGTFDNTQFHDYLFDWSPPGTFHIHRDGTLVHTGSGGFAVTVNRLFLGDGTGGANAHGETTAFRFIQDVATPAAASTWGRLKVLYR